VFSNDTITLTNNIIILQILHLNFALISKLFIIINILTLNINQASDVRKCGFFQAVFCDQRVPEFELLVCGAFLVIDRYFGKAWQWRVTKLSIDQI
jgi:hypothetical protein